jgi:uncharacterized protein
MLRIGNRHVYVTLLPLVGLIFFLTCTSLQAQALKFPQTKVPVNDYAEVITPEYEAQMNQLAHALLDQTGTAVVVATFRDLGGERPRIFANRLYEAWGIGKKGEDKGVLILVALKERRVAYETGYGIEGILPDAKMGEILDQQVIPFLRQDNYGKGLLNGMKAVAHAVAQDTAAQPKEKKGFPLIRTLRISFIILSILFIIFVLVARGKGFFPWRFIGGGSQGMTDGGTTGGFERKVISVVKSISRMVGAIVRRGVERRK